MELSEIQKLVEAQSISDEAKKCLSELLQAIASCQSRESGWALRGELQSTINEFTAKGVIDAQQHEALGALFTAFWNPLALDMTRAKAQEIGITIPADYSIQPEADTPILIDSVDALTSLQLDEINHDSKFLISPLLIEEEKDFSFRNYDCDDMKAKIQSMTKQWAKDPSTVRPLIVSIEDGHIYVKDGYCRLRAAKQAMEDGLMLDTIACESLLKYRPRCRPR